MGKYIVLTVLAVALGTILLARQGRLTDLDTSKAQAERQRGVIAREIARSAFEMGKSKLRRNFEGWRVDRTQVEHEGGYFDLSSSGPSGGPVTLTAVGYHAEEAYEITGEVTKDTSISTAANGITASIPIDFKVSGGGCSGNPCVSGFDLGGGEDQHGITLPSGTDTEEVCDEFDDKVDGIGGGCDVKARTEQRDEWIGQQMAQIKAEIQDAIERGSDSVTVCDGCKVGDLPTDSGILYVTDELQYNGEESWNGLVFVADGGAVRINGGGDAKNINGGLMMSDSTKFEDDEEFDLNGGNAVRYNSEVLKKYMDTLPTLRRETIKVRDRTEQFLRPSE